MNQKLLRLLALSFVASAPLLNVNCSRHGSTGSGGGDGGAAQTPGQALCASIAAEISKCGGGTACDQALVMDCQSLVGILSDTFIQATTACVKQGTQSPMACFVGALGGLMPTTAQEALATAFCSECALGTPGCDSVFFSTDGSKYALGTVILPFSDSLVAELQTSCTADLTCAASFVTCAEETLGKHALPTQTATCIITSLVSPGSGSSPMPMGSCTGSGGSSTSSGTGGAGGSGSGNGGAGGAGGGG